MLSPLSCLLATIGVSALRLGLSLSLGRSPALGLSVCTGLSDNLGLCLNGSDRRVGVFWNDDDGDPDDGDDDRGSVVDDGMMILIRLFC